MKGIMFHDWSSDSTFKAGTVPAKTVDIYAACAVAKAGRETRCGGGVEKGEPNWSRSTVWFKRPENVAMPARVAVPVKSLQAIACPSRAPIAKEASVCIIGIFAGKETPNKLGVRASGEATPDIVSAIERKRAALTVRLAPSKGERAEIAFRRKAKSAETAARLAEKAKAIASHSKWEGEEASRKAARMEWRRNLSRAIKAPVWL